MRLASGSDYGDAMFLSWVRVEPFCITEYNTLHMADHCGRHIEWRIR